MNIDLALCHWFEEIERSKGPVTHVLDNNYKTVYKNATRNVNEIFTKRLFC